jgi:hypothetical protein
MARTSEKSLVYLVFGLIETNQMTQINQTNEINQINQITVFLRWRTFSASCLGPYAQFPIGQWP